ncbi:MAG TPA: hypothetical protein VIM15_04745 [Gemmatimonadaceae bacterium]
MALVAEARGVRDVADARSLLQHQLRTPHPHESAQKQIDFAPFIKRFTGGDVVRTQAFDNFYPYPAVQRAYEEASFEIQGAIPEPGN